MLHSLKALLQDQIKDLYSAENQLIKALPKMVAKAGNENLKEAFEGHLEETRGHLERLAEAAQVLETKPLGKTCKAMQGLIEEGKEAVDEEGEGAVIDAALIAAARRVEHYEMAAYTSAHSMAEQLGESRIMRLLQKTLAEECGADEKLASILTDEVLPATELAAHHAAAPSARERRASR